MNNEVAKQTKNKPNLKLVPKETLKILFEDDLIAFYVLQDKFSEAFMCFKGKLELAFSIATVREWAVQNKYKDPNNWENVDTEEYKQAIYRHLLAIRRNEIIDKDSGLPHRDHVACNLAFLYDLQKKTVDKVI